MLSGIPGGLESFDGVSSQVDQSVSSNSADIPNTLSPARTCSSKSSSSGQDHNSNKQRHHMQPENMQGSLPSASHLKKPSKTAVTQENMQGSLPSASHVMKPSKTAVTTEHDSYSKRLLQIEEETLELKRERISLEKRKVELLGELVEIKKRKSLMQLSPSFSVSPEIKFVNLL